MSDLTMSILGFPAVNRDLSVQLLDPVTQNVVRTVTPFLDGTVRVPNIDPGAYEISVVHPNLVTPVLRRPPSRTRPRARRCRSLPGSPRTGCQWACRSSGAA